MIIAVTGHRPDKLGGYDISPTGLWVREETLDILRRAQTKHPELIIYTGMALGFDTIVAESCLTLDIPFVACIPFAGQESRWRVPQQQIYLDLLRSAAEVRYVCGPGYAAWKMQRRNEFMVNAAQYIITCWNGSAGGTKNCIDYARRKGKKIYCINPTCKTTGWFK